MLHCGTPNELKMLMPGELLAVTSPQARRARDLVRTLRGVSKALLVGDGIHIVVDDAGRRKPEIADALRQAGLGFDQIEQLRPSIEDLFVSLLDQPGDGA
jgi:ABC-2 type transport system ATP-binding protein